MEERTNIVPIDPGQQVEEQSELSPDDYSLKLAEDAIKFLEEDEFKEDTNHKFWERIEEYAAKKLGRVVSASAEAPPTETPVEEPMTKDQIAKFRKECLPWGKYSGQMVNTVLKKDPSSLHRMANKPLPFQVKLRRFLSSISEK